MSSRGDEVDGNNLMESSHNYFFLKQETCWIGCIAIGVSRWFEEILKCTCVSLSRYSVGMASRPLGEGHVIISFNLVAVFVFLLCWLTN